MAGLYMFYLIERDCNCIDFITVTERRGCIFYTPEWKIEIPFISLSGQDYMLMWAATMGGGGG